MKRIMKIVLLAAAGLFIVMMLPAESEQAQTKEKNAYAPAHKKSDKKKRKKYRYIKECPLSKETQRKIFKICEKKGVSFEFVMALIKTESSFRPNAVSDSGGSVGLMQIQERWHRALMKKLGCTDLRNPVQNVTVGVTLLSGLLKKYEDPDVALMAYNGGERYAVRLARKGITSTYARTILKQAKKYEKENRL